ncbi:MAG: hypothetical protein KIT81_15800, partial [Alphaproteobacteria bacterium]|nr:hypothetical protein [Alphaproteobacteria bacterium]
SRLDLHSRMLARSGSKGNCAERRSLTPALSRKREREKRAAFSREREREKRAALSHNVGLSREADQVVG